jgi:hypothetical protein
LDLAAFKFRGDSGIFHSTISNDVKILFSTQAVRGVAETESALRSNRRFSLEWRGVEGVGMGVDIRLV